MTKCLVQPGRDPQDQKDTAVDLTTHSKWMAGLPLTSDGGTVSPGGKVFARIGTLFITPVLFAPEALKLVSASKEHGESYSSQSTYCTLNSILELEEWSL